jgi:hypothetical protein
MQLFARGLLQVSPTSVVRSVGTVQTLTVVLHSCATEISNHQALAGIHELGLIHLDIKSGTA